VLLHIKSPVAIRDLLLNWPVLISFASVLSNPKYWHNIFWRLLSQFLSTTNLQLKPSYIWMSPSYVELHNLMLGAKTEILNERVNFSVWNKLLNYPFSCHATTPCPLYFWVENRAAIDHEKKRRK
jgi:hypothetical protein